jgi:uncharacterized protein YjiS (DUF1127 family)
MWTYTKAEGADFIADGRGVLARLTAVIRSVRRRLAAWESVAQGRAELSRLSGRDLQDMGVSRATALAEMRKPFWRE